MHPAGSLLRLARPSSPTFDDPSGRTSGSLPLLRARRRAARAARACLKAGRPAVRAPSSPQKVRPHPPSRPVSQIYLTMFVASSCVAAKCTICAPSHACTSAAAARAHQPLAACAPHILGPCRCTARLLVDYHDHPKFIQVYSRWRLHTRLHIAYVHPARASGDAWTPTASRPTASMMHQP